MKDANTIYILTRECTRRDPGLCEIARLIEEEKYNFLDYISEEFPYFENKDKEKFLNTMNGDKSLRKLSSDIVKKIALKLFKRDKKESYVKVGTKIRFDNCVLHNFRNHIWVTKWKTEDFKFRGSIFSYLPKEKSKDIAMEFLRELFPTEQLYHNSLSLLSSLLQGKDEAIYFNGNGKGMLVECLSRIFSPILVTILCPEGHRNRITEEYGYIKLVATNEDERNLIRPKSIHLTTVNFIVQIDDEKYRGREFSISSGILQLLIELYNSFPKEIVTERNTVQHDDVEEESEDSEDDSYFIL